MSKDDMTPIKPADVPDGFVWDASQQLWVGPQSEFERGVRAGVTGAVKFFRDENGSSAVDGWPTEELDRIEGSSIAEVLDDDAKGFLS